jgi:hypothetical protein
MNLVIIYTALSVFGLGVTIIDFLGILDRPGEDSGNGGEADTGGQNDEGQIDDDGQDDDGQGGDGDNNEQDDEHNAHEHGSYLGPGSSGIKAVTLIMGLLRTAVYFSLGAGPTGLFALFRGLSRGESFLWAAGVGTGIAVLARALRKFIRRDLDSSIKPEEFLMEKAVLLLPLNPGTIAKAVVKQYGKETEIYVKCGNPGTAIEKGAEVRIIDFDNELYWIEPVDSAAERDK